MRYRLLDIAKNVQGQTLVEYALVIGTISIAAVFALGTIAGAVSGRFSGITTYLNSLIP